MANEEQGIQSEEKYSKVRDAHRTELAEDYVELILDEIERVGQARLTAIATRLGVSHPTVSKSLRRLEREGFVTLERYKSIDLTPLGVSLAAECRARHDIVLRFLKRLGLDEATAQHDAEGIEHHVSPRTLELMEQFGKER